MNTNSLSFFTAVTYGNSPASFGEKLLERVDDYFYLKGHKAKVIPSRTQGNKEAVVIEPFKPSSSLQTALKIASYITIVIPFVVLAAKLILRNLYQFYVLPATSNNFFGRNSSAFFPPPPSPPTSSFSHPPSPPTSPSQTFPISSFLPTISSSSSIFSTGQNQFPFNVPFDTPMTLSAKEVAQLRIEIDETVMDLEQTNQGISCLYEDSIFYYNYQYDYSKMNADHQPEGSYVVVRRFKESDLIPFGITHLNMNYFKLLNMDFTTLKPVAPNELRDLKREYPNLDTSGNWMSGTSHLIQYRNAHLIWKEINVKEGGGITILRYLKSQEKR